jgi:hypothetical protein
MRVIIGCEFSQIVTQAFRDRGHEAFSCDILSTEGKHPEWHFQEDVFEVLKREKPFDLGIFHPPCTFLSYAAIKYWNAPGRDLKRKDAMEFFIRLYNLNIPRIAIENPVGYPNTVFRKPDQIVKPFYFGENEQKNICLWLKNLPPLIHAKEETLFDNKTHIPKPKPTWIDKSGKARYFIDEISGCSKYAQKYRSRFFVSIAAAMADQWGGL